ncbi:MAG TPA: CRISPR-associated protein Cas4 [Verrucomicrobiae bacterium]
MTPAPPDWGGEREPIPLSAINQYLFCPRRAALIHLEGIFEDNEHTLRGDIVHEHSDLAGYEVAKGVLLWRALPVWSEQLGLNGKCDIVEVEPRSDVKSQMSDLKSARPSGAAYLKSEISDLKSAGIAALRPVEFKLGKRRRFENDDAQLCAQAICLEEMFNLSVPRGAIFHADSKRRREVEFTAELRARAEQAVAELHALLGQSEISNLKSEIPRLPPAVWRPACEECSLFDLCLPKATAQDRRAERLAASLFHI